MIVTDPSPSFGRLVTAFVVAPWAPALAVVLPSAPWSVSPDVIAQYVFIGLLYGLVPTYVTVLIIGLPLLAELRHRYRVRMTVLSYTLIGVAAAELSAMVLTVPLAGFLAIFVGSVPFEFIGHLMVRLAGLGALGGMTFWAVGAARRTPRPFSAA